ncbi:hypothetical protein C8Q72DRAFT_829805 [Fomitopsis betulina]|nr:hypothetical protein C8Q72DRAFT_829805 [Fomitopsis betulina]
MPPRASTAIKWTLATIFHLVLSRQHRTRREGLFGLNFKITPKKAVLRLPVEICELIIDIVAEYVGGWVPRSGDPWWRTLVSCALTCRDWYARAQHHRLKIVELRDRSDVTMLYNLLRGTPRLKATVQEVELAGSLTGDRLPLLHVGTFITKLVLQLPKLRRLSIYGTLWTYSSVRVDDLKYLRMFHHLATLTLFRVTFTNASQLGRLIAALPELLTLSLIGVLCTQGRNVSPTAFYLGRSTLLRGKLHLVDPLAPPVLNLLTHTPAKPYFLQLTLQLHSSSPDTETREKLRLLEATALSVGDLTIVLDLLETGLPMLDNIDDVLNLSQHKQLDTLRLHLICPLTADASYTWLARVVGALGSDISLHQFYIVFDVSEDPKDERVSALLCRLAHHRDLDLLDQAITRLFYNIEQEGCVLGIRLPADVERERWGWSVGELGKTCWDKWERMIREKMPRANKRGILSTLVYIGGPYLNK